MDLPLGYFSSYGEAVNCEKLNYSNCHCAKRLRKSTFFIPPWNVQFSIAQIVKNLSTGCVNWCPIISLFLAAALCAAAAWLFAVLRTRSKELISERNLREAAETDLRELVEKFHALDREYAEFRGRDSERRQINDEKIALLEKVRKELETAFGAAATKASAEALAKLQESNAVNGVAQRERLENVLKPMRDCVDRLEGRVQQNDRQWNESMARFEEQIRQMLLSNKELDIEAKRLNRTLRQSHLRGRWGELHLRRLVEMAGMREHVDFDEQVAVAADSGTLRADMVIHLPDGRNVIVDAKAVMEAYAAAEEADSSERRMELRKQHGQNVFSRIQELGRKNYWKFFAATFDYVILFLPGDNIYAAALEVRPELFDEAVERHVLLASPMTLLALLKTIASGWAQSATAREANAIVDLAKVLIERTQVVWEKLSDTGRHLRRTVDSYNGTVASIESRLRPTLQNFSRMKSLRSEEPKPLEQIETSTRSMTSEEVGENNCDK